MTDEKKEYPKPGSKKVQLFMGRMQPIHIGHKKIIDSMDNPVVIVVKGEKSSEDRTKNPLSAEYQIQLIKKVAPHAEIMTVSSGFLPKIITQLREKGMEPDTIFAGADRIDGYKKQINGANARMEPEYHYDVEFKETERVTSATTVRNAIRANDEAGFKKNMPKELWSEFETMKKLLGESLDVNIKSFEDWLAEEGGGAATTTVNTSDQVAKKDQLLGDGKIAKRKKLADSVKLKDKEEKSKS